MASVAYIPTAKLLSLISAADPQRKFNIRILNSTRLSLDDETFTSVAMVDFAEEKVTSSAPPIERLIDQPTLSSKSNYKLTAFGERIECSSLKDLLRIGLLALENKSPGTLDKLSNIKKQTKRIVARNPEELFDTVGLSEKFSVRLMNGWWYGTNNSKQETEEWLKRACECAGLNWGGKDFRIE